MRTKLLSALVAVIFAMTLPFACAWAASGDLDEIEAFNITVDVNEDATLDMVYHVEWKVLDSTSEGPLEWVRIGIPNKHYDSMVALSDSIDSISYSSSGGSYVRIDLDRPYYAGEVAVFDFEIVQDYMYQVGRDNQGEAVYEFTPGWFDDIVVDSLQVRWNADKVERLAPAAQQDGDYYTWTSAMQKGDRMTVTVGYPDDAFAFDIDKTIMTGNSSSSWSDSEDSDLGDVILGLFGLGVFFLFGFGIFKVITGMARAVLSVFNKGSGFSTGKKITRTKVVYYPVCQGCGAARPEGKDTCDYCGRSFIQSEEVVEEKDIPETENEIKHKQTSGEYAYSSEPNTFLRVLVTPIIASSVSHRSGSSGRSSGRGSGGSCACASSCACACGCACACACAGGGRAGCSTKDFYNTDLKLSQLARGVTHEPESPRS